MIDYKVGQVVYLLSPKTLKIMPALIVEEITRKTVKATQTQFVLELPDKKGTRTVMSEVSAKVFNDIGILRTFMIDNTRKSVEQLIENAIDMKDSVFGESFVNVTSEARSKEVLDMFVESKEEKLKVVKPTPKDAHVQKNVKDVIMNGGKENIKENIQQLEA